jgi:protein gp37
MPFLASSMFSVEWRIAKLQSAKPAVAFLSVEPLLEDLGGLDLRDIHWVIVGGESGPGARQMSRDWVRSVRAECRAHHIPFFFKQWGGVRKSETGRTLDGKTYDEYPAGQRNIVASADERTRLLARMAVA